MYSASTAMTVHMTALTVHMTKSGHEKLKCLISMHDHVYCVYILGCFRFSFTCPPISCLGLSFHLNDLGDMLTVNYK